MDAEEFLLLFIDTIINNLNENGDANLIKSIFFGEEEIVYKYSCGH